MSSIWVWVAFIFTPVFSFLSMLIFSRYIDPEEIKEFNSKPLSERLLIMLGLAGGMELIVIDLYFSFGSDIAIVCFICISGLFIYSLMMLLAELSGQIKWLKKTSFSDRCYVVNSIAFLALGFILAFGMGAYIRSFLP